MNNVSGLNLSKKSTNVTNLVCRKFFKTCIKFQHLQIKKKISKTCTQTLTPNLLRNIYLLLLHVSATEHGHLQAATRFLGYMAYIAISTSKEFVAPWRWPRSVVKHVDAINNKYCATSCKWQFLYTGQLHGKCITLDRICSHSHPKITPIKRTDTWRTVFKITALNLTIYETPTTCDKVPYVSLTSDLCMWKSNSRMESYS